MGERQVELEKEKTESKMLEKISKFWFPFVLWSFIIFSFSSFPTAKTSQIYWQDFVIKKLAHITEYAIFTVLLYRALINSNVNKKKAAILSIILAVLYGASDEFHQSFTPGREPRIRDVLFDAFGSILSVYYIWNCLSKAPKKIRVWARKLQIM